MERRGMVNLLPVNSFQTGKKWQQLGVIVAVCGILSACGPGPAPSGTSDPNEQVNRAVHGFNRHLDTALVRPASQVYGTVIPAPVRQGVNNFAENMEAPGDVVNGILQGRPENAAQNVLRFAVNLTMGIGGVFDAATAIGLPRPQTDFGETLHVWGAPEGNYMELPVLGPSTERDTVGRVVDIVMNPTRLLGTAEGDIVTGADVGSRLGDRYRFTSTVDGLLYDSADSYVQTRLLYLQNRRFELGQQTSDDAFLDPYEDPYAEQ
jgi:phospholipid-binding lipoprotein MlaA